MTLLLLPCVTLICFFNVFCTIKWPSDQDATKFLMMHKGDLIL